MKRITNPSGYSLTGLIIASIIVNFSILALSSYMSTGVQIENKNYSDLNRQNLLEEIQYIFRDPVTCKENLKDLGVTQGITNIPILKRPVRSGDSITYNEAFKVNDVYGGKWQIESLRLENFRGRNQVGNKVNGVMEFKIEVSPTPNNYYDSNVTESIPLIMSVQTDSNPWKIESCQPNVKIIDNQELCLALSGTIDTIGRCIDTTFPGGMTVKAPTSSRIHVSENLNIGPTQVDTTLTTRGLLKVNGDIHFNADWGSITGNTISAENITAPLNITVQEVCYKSKIIADGTTFSGNLNQVASCNGPNQYIKSIDPSTWTATCGTRSSP